MLTDIEYGDVPIQQLTRMQSLIWTGQHLDPDSPLYNMAFRIQIDCDLDIPIFQQAFCQIVAASDSHRATIETQNGIPHFRIQQEMDFDFPVIDFSSEPNPIESAIQWTDQQCQNIFDLQVRLFDTALVKIGNHSYIWFINHHHLISDAWGATQLLRLQETVYLALKADRPTDLSQLPPEFPEYRGDAQHITDQSVDAPLPIFYGHQPPLVSTRSVRQLVLDSGSTLSEKLFALTSSPAAKSFSTDLSLLNLSLALLASFIFRTTNQGQICIGIPFHNRNAAADKRALGMFIKVIPVTIHVDESDTFGSLFKKAQTSTNEYLKQATGTSHPPPTRQKFNAILNFIHASFGSFDSQPVRAEWLHPGHSDREHHLRLHVERFSSGSIPKFKMDFNSDVFSSQDQNRAGFHFRALVDAMTRDWNQLVSNVPIASESEATIIADLPRTAYTDSMLTNRIDESVRSFANRPAVQCPLQSLIWTYSELDTRVQQIVQQFQQLKLKPGQRVGIALGRSPDSVASIVAAIRTGLAFVPLDPYWPSKRINFVLDDCDAQLVVTSSDLLPNPISCRRLDLNLIDFEQAPANSISTVPPDGDRTAYVMYTSGFNRSSQGG